MIVEIIYLANEQQSFQQKLDVEQHTTIEQAIKNSTLLTQYPDLQLETLSVGIYSKAASLSTLLSEGDRIEIYRPLTISPMEKRRLLAQRKK